MNGFGFRFFASVLFSTLLFQLLGGVANAASGKKVTVDSGLSYVYVVPEMCKGLPAGQAMFDKAELELSSKGDIKAGEFSFDMARVTPYRGEGSPTYFGGPTKEQRAFEALASRLEGGSHLTFRLTRAKPLEESDELGNNYVLYGYLLLGKEKWNVSFPAWVGIGGGFLLSHGIIIAELPEGMSLHSDASSCGLKFDIKGRTE